MSISRYQVGVGVHYSLHIHEESDKALDGGGYARVQNGSLEPSSETPLTWTLPGVFISLDDTVHAECNGVRVKTFMMDPDEARAMAREILKVLGP